MAGNNNNQNQNQDQIWSSMRRQQSIVRCIESLAHASECHDVDYHLPSCVKMKRVISHFRSCARFTPRPQGQGQQQQGEANRIPCHMCKQLIALCCYHAKDCTRGHQNQNQEGQGRGGGNGCPIPYCAMIKRKLNVEANDDEEEPAQRRPRPRLASKNDGSDGGTSQGL